MRKTVLIVLVFFQALQIAKAQDYLAASNNAIYQINADFSATYLSTVALPAFHYISDVAVSPSGTLYGIVNTGKLIEIDPASGIFNELAGNVAGVALGCSNDNQLYYMGGYQQGYALFRYDLASHTSQLMIALEFGTPGDFTFYKGNVIFQLDAPDAEQPHLNIVAYNIASGMLSTIYCLPYGQTHQFYGLMNRFDNCGGNHIIASNIYSDFYEIDLENKTIALLDNTFGLDISGIASATEHLASACPDYQFADLDCTLGVAENLAGGFSVYPNPADQQITINSDEKINEILIYDSAGKLILQAQNNTAIDVSQYPKGIYLLKTLTSDKTHNSKFIKQ